jgi:predicted RNase H-like HicB family nuclease
METRLTYTYWKDGPYFVGYLNEYPDDSTQGLTLTELEEALKEVYETQIFFEVRILRHPSYLAPISSSLLHL